MISSSDSTVYYSIISPAGATSFNLTKEGSNFAYNQVILHALIGTLVKHGSSGKFEPYLAESWVVSDDRKSWSFTIRDNLIAENGEKITAKLFRDSLLQNLKEYSKKSSAIVFDNLIGWNDFVKGKTEGIHGMKVDNRKIIFNFEKHPDDFLEIIRNPFFGLWINQGDRIISTSAYKIDNVKKDEVTLSLREDWFSSAKDSFKKIKFSFSDSSLTHNPIPRNMIIQVSPSIDSSEYRSDSFWIIMPPTISDSFVLSPFKEGFFKDIKNREVFQNRINSLGKDYVDSPFLYPNSPSVLARSNKTDYSKSQAKGLLTFSLERLSLSTKEIEKIREMIKFALEGSGQEFKLIPRNMKDKNFLKTVQSNSFFDGRIASVGSGAYPSYSILKMMFCTKLGITFPGHEEEFCNLIEENLVMEKEIDQKFIDFFNHSLYKKAIVIPFAHHSAKLLVSNSLNPKFLPATTLYPLFENLREN